MGRESVRQRVWLISFTWKTMKSGLRDCLLWDQVKSSAVAPTGHTVFTYAFPMRFQVLC